MVSHLFKMISNYKNGSQCTFCAMQIHICEPEFLANMLASTLVLWRVSQVRGSHCVAQVELKFPILPQPPMCGIGGTYHSPSPARDPYQKVYKFECKLNFSLLWIGRHRSDIWTCLLKHQAVLPLTLPGDGHILQAEFALSCINAGYTPQVFNYISKQ